jgi:predicted nuclease with TOPRIM domain
MDFDKTTIGQIAAGIGASLYLLRKTLLSDRVTAANDNAQINMIANLQAERDAAVKRADEAISQRDAVMSVLSDLKVHIAQLESQVERLSGEVSALRGEGGAHA